MRMSPSIDLKKSLRAVLGDGVGAAERAEEDEARQRTTVQQILGRFSRANPAIRREMVILADEVGLGKTYVALATAVSILDSIRCGDAPADFPRQMPAVLVLTPQNDALHNKWVREVSSFRVECASDTDSLSWIVPATGECENLVELTRAIRNTRKARPAIVVAKTSCFGARLKDADSWRRRALAATFYHCGIASDSRVPWCRLVLGSGSVSNEPALRDLRQAGSLWEETDAWAPDLKEKYLAALERSPLLAEALVAAAAERDAGRLCTYLDELTRAAMKECWPMLPLIIIDEVHNLKNPRTTVRRKLENYLTGAASRVLALSATPFQLAHEELSSVLELRRLAALCRDRMVVLNQQVLDLESAMRRSRHVGDEFRARWTALESADHGVVSSAWDALSRAPACGREELFSSVSPIRVEKALRSSLKLQEANQDLQRHLRPFIIRHRRDTTHRSYWVGRNAARGVERASPTPGFDWAPGAEVEPGSELVHYLFMRLVSLAKDGKGKAALGEELTGSYRHLTQTAASWKKIERSRDERLLAYKNLLDRIISTRSADRNHAKIKVTADRVLDSFRNGQKSIVFCVHVKTAEAVRDEVQRRITAELGDRRDAVFDSKSAFENFNKRFFDRRETLYSLIQDHPLLGVGNSGPVGVPTPLRLAERELLRVSELLASFGEDPQVQKPDRRAILAAVEHVAATFWEQSSRGRDWLDAALGGAVQLRCAMLEATWIGDGRSLLRARGRHDDPHAAVGSADPLDADAEDTAASTRRRLGEEESAALWSAQLRRAGGAGVAMYFREGLVASSAWHMPLLPKYHARELQVLDLDTRRVAGQAFQRILRSEEFLIRYLADAHKADEEKWADFLSRRYVEKLHGHRESLRDRVHAYFETLVRSSGAGKEALLNAYRAAAQNRNIVQLVQGGMDRDRYFLGFNTPYRPEILISTSVGQEGIDLHRECRHVIHHDLCWNPATIEQRTGRVDRIGSKIERERAAVEVGEIPPTLDIAVPYLAGTYDERMFNELHRRAQLFEVTMGGDFKVDGRLSESEALSAAQARKQAGIDSEDEDMGTGEELLGGADLPASMVEALRVDLAVYRPRAKRPKSAVDVAAQGGPIPYKEASNIGDEMLSGIAMPSTIPAQAAK